MARDIPVGNGEMLVTFDRTYRIRDLYYPHVGMPNHTGGHVQRMGVWADGRFAWIEDDGWTRDLRYGPDTLVTDVRLRHEGLGLEIRCADAVDHERPVLLRRMTVTDLRGDAREVRIFLHQDFSIGGSPVGDTVAYDPETAGLLFYKDDLYFLVNGCDEHKCGIDHFATGAKRIGDAEGTWRDAEDGVLAGHPIAQGSVDATVGFTLQLAAHGSGKVITWIAAGRTHEDVRALNREIMAQTADRLLRRTEAYWRLWACKEPIDLVPLPEEVARLFRTSLLVVRTQIDQGGAILAANDTDIQHFAGDHYSYCWPRDGALVAYALALAGQGTLSRAFFRFSAAVLDGRPYFLHKYNPTGTLASSWHPSWLDGRRVLPIQQDETALVLWALRRHFLIHRDVEFIKSVWTPLVLRPAHWLLEHRDAEGLPRPSWDLWEERRGVHAFTTATTIGALEAAAAFCTDLGESAEAERCSVGAEEMRDALDRIFWSDAKQRFARMVRPRDDGGYDQDFTADAANFALFAFGAVAPDDPRMIAEMRAIRARLAVRTDVGGLARYERDPYHRIEHGDLERIPGNPWVICTLWPAYHDIALAQTVEQLEAALEPLRWAARRALPSGVLAEQFDPHTGSPVSVSPLTWSHASVVSVVMHYLLKHAELTGRRTGGMAELAAVSAW